MKYTAIIPGEEHDHLVATEVIFRNALARIIVLSEQIGADDEVYCEYCGMGSNSDGVVQHESYCPAAIAQRALDESDRTAPGGTV